MASSKTVFLDDFDINRQPEVAIWSPKPEIFGDKIYAIAYI